LGISGTTNMLKVHLVGDVLVSGTVVNELSTCGPLCVCKTEEEALQKFRRGDILVLPKTTNATMPLIRQASGIVTEMDGVNSHAAIAA
ncbi:MAG TPA: pyruvate kinase, partial [Ruminococcaceae bacterium]|nr:pyruvate kinase [Oscillospiraceae bacterium]